MPRQFAAPSHALLRSLAQEMFPDVFDLIDWRAPVKPPEIYARMLDGLGDVSVWETEYVQRLAPEEEGHPVRHFTMSTAMRPFLDKLERGQAADYLAAYDEALSKAYPVSGDGSVFFPFRRVFFVVSI
jgi:trans-aconitate 2-methyltransferase